MGRSRSPPPISPSHRDHLHTKCSTVTASTSRPTTRPPTDDTVSSWQDTFLALHRAATLEELWTVLLVPHGIRSSSAWEEPSALFRRFHADDPEHAATTVALLCTDHRWRKGVNRLIDQLAGSDVLDDGALDQLSDWFLGDALVVSAPAPMVPSPSWWRCRRRRTHRLRRRSSPLPTEAGPISAHGDRSTVDLATPAPLGGLPRRRAESGSVGRGADAGRCARHARRRRDGRRGDGRRRAIEQGERIDAVKPAWRGGPARAARRATETRRAPWRGCGDATSARRSVGQGASLGSEDGVAPAADPGRTVETRATARPRWTHRSAGPRSGQSRRRCSTSEARLPRRKGIAQSVDF